MDDEKDPTHIDNLLTLFGVKPEEDKNAPALPYAGRGKTNPPLVSPNAPYPTSANPAYTTKTSSVPSHAQNQQAIRDMVSSAANSVANADFGNVDPRTVSYVPGAVLGAKFGPRVATASDPLNAQLRAADRLQKQQYVNQVLSGETPEQYGARTKISGASMPRNYANVASGEQMPEAVLSTVTDMSKNNPMGTGAWDVAARDAANMQKIKDMGMGHLTLQGQGLPAQTTPPFQMMLEPGTLTSTGALPTQAAATKAPKFFENVPRYAGAFLSNPVVKGALHGANLLGTAVQGATDIYNKDPVGGLITAGQALGSVAGAPELAIPIGEAARYLRANPPQEEPGGNAFASRFAGAN